MLKIRLQRIGRKNEPSFRLVLTDSKSAAKKKALEVLGSHDFRKDGTILKKDRIEYWISNGAQVSDTAHNLLVSNKIISGKKKNVLPKKTVAAKPEEAAPAAAATPAEAPEASAAPVETPAPAEAPTEAAAA